MLSRTTFGKFGYCSRCAFSIDAVNGFAVAVVIGAVLLGNNPACADDGRDRSQSHRREHRHSDHHSTPCTGAMTGAFGHVVVPAGADCSLSDAIVQGDVRVHHNASLSVGPSTTIDGDVEARHCRFVLLNGSVGIAGDVEIHECTARSGYTGPGIQIGGNFKCHGNSAECVAANGAVGGDARINGNVSLAPSDISVNAIGGDLKCHHNSPAPVHALGPNLVSGRLDDQCSKSLGFSALAVPPEFQADLLTFGLGGPISLNNFHGRYVNGGIIPFGGAAIDITHVPQPALALNDFIAEALSGSTITATAAAVVAGSPGTAVSYETAYGPTPLTIKNIAVFVPRNGVLYKLYLSYNAGDALENRFIAAFERVLSSFQFPP